MVSAPWIRAPALAGAEAIDRAVVSTVAYSDVFEYPLRDIEVHRYLHRVHATAEATAAALARCTAPDGPLTHRHGYYTLRGREALVDARRERAVHAARLWPAAIRFGQAIGGLPFVRMVAVTGSLAWDNTDQAGDIDYLIVTEPDRLWITRWLVGLLVRAARLEGAPKLCPNYVVSTRALRFADHNLYAAYELVRATPIVGLGMYRRLRRANPWSAAYLPNAVAAPRPPDLPARSARGGAQGMMARLRRLGERALSTRAAAAWERYEMRYRIRKRLKQYVAQEEASYHRDWYKGHSIGHRHTTLNAFAERLRRLEGDGL